MVKHVEFAACETTKSGFCWSTKHLTSSSRLSALVLSCFLRLSDSFSDDAFIFMNLRVQIYDQIKLKCSEEVDQHAAFNPTKHFDGF